MSWRRRKASRDKRRRIARPSPDGQGRLPPLGSPDPSAPGRSPSTIGASFPELTVDLALGEGGPIAAAFTAYEPRPQQVRMARAVEEALRAGRHLLVEAGTGVGKSFAYLVPALRWAAEHDTKVAVATSTIALQEQLATRDLPLLARTLPWETSFALVKGRGNYICTRRLRLALEPSGDLFPDAESRRQLHEVDAALARGAGSRQDLGFLVRDDVWDSVRAESGNCLHKACPHYAACPYQAGRRRADEARVLVMNHHVLLADLALRRSGASFLPDVDAIVVDEAHDFEDTAAEALGERVSSRGMGVVLGRLWNERRGAGLLARMADPGLRERVDEARRASKGFFDGLREALAPAGGAGGVVAVEGPLRVDGDLAARLEDLARAVSRALPAAPSKDLALELAARANGLSALAEGVERLAEGPDADHVQWAEWDVRGNATVVRAPVDVGPRLRESLWDAYKTVVLTSATLATGRPPSFRYARERLGLVDAEEMAVGSPFDFPRQARVVIRTDLPDPARRGPAFEAALPEAILDAVRRTQGGAFVLFTSYESMRRAADAVRAHLEGDGLEVLVHGEDLPRTAMLERFREVNAVLFGVASFWQGVDVPGDALRNVVIARLPFDVPTHPLARAREARLEREGRSAFDEISLPGAAIRLKQGFGRLIRRATDRGIVVILDPRIVTRAYGRVLLESLPECPVVCEPEVPGEEPS